MFFFGAVSVSHFYLKQNAVTYLSSPQMWGLYRFANSVPQAGNYFLFSLIMAVIAVEVHNFGEYLEGTLIV